MRDRIVPVDVLFDRASEGGAAFELLADDDVPNEADPLSEDAEFTGWDARNDGDPVERDVWDDEEESSDDDEVAPEELGPLAVVASAAIAPLPEKDLSFAQHQVYGEARAYGAALVRLLPYLRQRANWIAGGDPHLAGDLTQEALIELWEIDASRFDEDDQPYLKQALVRRMYHAAEREFSQEMLVPRSRVRAFVKLRKEIGPSIHDLGPHRPFTFSDSEEE